MAGQDTVLNRLARLLSSMDDDALVALANRGLVRRAYKDMETASPAIESTDAQCATLQVGGFQVTVPDVLSNATCDCPSAGICRHIVAALIHLRDCPDSGKTKSVTPLAAEAARSELLVLDDATLRKWAGKASWRRAIKALAEGLTAEIQQRDAITIRLPRLNIECRWLPGGGLDAMLCSCHAAGVCDHRLMAVLAFQLDANARTLNKELAALQASAGTARTRGEVLQSTRAVLHEMMALGLSRLSDTTRARLQTLAASAHGVDLPRLERMLQTLADEVAVSLRRDARANATRLLDAASRIEVLCRALAHPTPALVGRHKSKYERVGDLQLIGLGARRWQNRSGYVGLTVYFWDVSARNWATWSDTRPRSVVMFDPKRAYRTSGPWEGCESPSEASRSEIRLTSAYRNPVGRLSARSATTACVLDPVIPTEAPRGIDDWTALWQRAPLLFGGGLQERGEQDEIVLLHPTSWAPAQYDPIQQQVRRPVLDARENVIPLVLTFDEEMTADAVRFLESYDPARCQGVLGVLRMADGQLVVEPISIHDDGKIINVTLDRLPKKRASRSKKRSKQRKTADAAAGPAIAQPNDDLPEAMAVGSATSLGLLLATIQAQLELIAEAGVSVAHDTSALEGFAERCDRLGLTSCSGPISDLPRQLHAARRNTERETRITAGQSLLNAYYMTSLAASLESLAVVL